MMLKYHSRIQKVLSEGVEICERFFCFFLFFLVFFIVDEGKEDQNTAINERDGSKLNAGLVAL